MLTVATKLNPISGYKELKMKHIKISKSYMQHYSITIKLHYVESREKSVFKGENKENCVLSPRAASSYTGLNLIASMIHLLTISLIV